MTTAFQSNAFQSNAFQVSGGSQGDRSGWWRLQLIKAVQDQNKQREALKALSEKKEPVVEKTVKEKVVKKKVAVRAYVKREIVEDYQSSILVPIIDESEIIAKQRFLKIVKDNELIIAKIMAIPKAPDAVDVLDDLSEIEKQLDEQAAFTVGYNNAALLALGIL